MFCRLRWTLALLFVFSGCQPGETPQSPEGSASSRPEATSDSRASVPSDLPVILAFGDSLTAGLGVLAADSYPAQLERALRKRGHQYQVINAGISGDTTAGGLSRLDAGLKFKPRIVILELGANDGLRGLPIDEARKNLGEMIRRFQEGGAQVLLAGLTLPRNYGPDYISAFENMFVELARTHQTVRIPFFLEGVAGRPELNNDDGLHPNAKGYAIIVEQVLTYLEPLL